MALALDGSTGYLEWNKGAGSLPVSALPCSLVIYAAQANLTGNQQFMACMQQASGSNAVYVNGDAGNSNIQATMNGTAAVKTYSLTSGAFSVLVAVFAATNSRLSYANSGSAPGTDTTAVTDNVSTLDRITVGAAHNAGLAARLFFLGSLCEFHICSGALSATNVSNLVAGTVLPEGLPGYVTGWQLKNTTDLLDASGTRTLTLVGGVTNSGLAHPIVRSQISAGVQAGNDLPGGSFLSQASGITSGVLSADDLPGGTFGLQPGTFSFGPLKRNGGVVAASVAISWMTFLNATGGSFVVTKTGLSTDGAGMVSGSDFALVTGQQYHVTWREANGKRGWCLFTAG